MSFDGFVSHRAHLRVGVILLNTGCCYDVAIVHANGDVDQAVAAALRVEVIGAVNRGVSAVIVDISDLSRLSTAGARALRGLRALTRARQVELSLASRSRVVQLPPPDVFAVHASVVDALAALPACTLHVADGAESSCALSSCSAGSHRADHGLPGHLCLAITDDHG
ncbi:MAG TPA: STAS domain-containing protein [Umezawaea sp.]|nr:STAS domain-containing protein [Umezawaea sp.]